jgi:hypothetical protein
VKKEERVGTVLMLLGVIFILAAARYFVPALYFLGAVFIAAASVMVFRKRRTGGSR